MDENRLPNSTKITVAQIVKDLNDFTTKTSPSSLLFFSYTIQAVMPGFYFNSSLTVVFV